MILLAHCYMQLILSTNKRKDTRIIYPRTEKCLVYNDQIRVNLL